MGYRFHMASSFYQRTLPDGLTAFASPEGRALLTGALTDGTAEAFFPLIANLHTQAEPSWCGLGTLVTVLNALQIDPGRVWKGSWRWFGEELLTCCKSLDQTTAEGVTLIEVACLARCNGATVAWHHAGPDTLDAFRADLIASVTAPQGPFVIASYHRGSLGQTGSGHFSPLGALHVGSDRVLVLDVARFKYPPHWVPVTLLWEAMRPIDDASGQPRGWLSLRRDDRPDRPDEDDTRALTDRLTALGVDCPAPPRRSEC
jgi:glutathione gamma-glutamylcysteinyltransferase